MYQGWTAKMYKSIGKDEQIRANEDNKMKERIQIPMKTMPPLPQKKK